MAFPAWVDFESAEQAAAVMARGLSGSSEAWGTLLANAQAVLGARTDTVHSDLPSSYSFDEWRDVIAAARILDLAATNHGLRDPENRNAAAILAACAFGMSGTAVSATAVIRSHGLLESRLSPSELVALALSAPSLSRDIFRKLPEGSKHRACVEHVAAFLGTGNEVQLSAAVKALEEATQEEFGAWEGYLLRLSRLPLVHAGRLATAKVLRKDESRFPDGYLDRLVSESPMLLPSQYEGLKDHAILASDQNLLITLPTGTGKTLLGEIALLGSLGRDPGLVCYITPYVALGRQVARRISRHTPSRVRVRRLMGGYKEPAPLDPKNDFEVVVATPERFDAVLRLSPELVPYIRCVVFDEAHLIANGLRGLRLEGLLTRLRLGRERGKQLPRFVLLSAVLSNAGALATWLDIAPENVISGTWRPSAKRLLRWTEGGKLRLHAGDDPLRSTPNEVMGETQLPWPNPDFYPASHIGAARKLQPLALQNVAYLAEFAYQKHEQPVLCVCFGRSKTRYLANQIAQRFAPLEPLPRTIKNVTKMIDARYPYLRPLRQALQRGVAYHNSSLPHPVREGIEQAVEDRELSVVSATTTLAEGVDLPFRVTILADWLMFDDGKNRPMDSLLFKNIAGRCGRAGQFTEGDTIVFDNPVGDPEFTSPARRPGLQSDIFFPASQPVLKSAVGLLDQRLAVATIGSHLLAAIPENPDVDDLSSAFLAHSFAHQTNGTGIVAKRIFEAYGDILNADDGQALAVAASPAQLTPFGEAARQAGLSPATARRLRAALGDLSDQGSSREGLISIGAALLGSLADVAEQENSDLRRVVNPKARPVVRLDELEHVLDHWLAGESPDRIFATLPSSRRSTRKLSVQEWLQGSNEESTWFDKFEKFSDFMNQCVEFFLPWILRSARPLSELDGQPERPWGEWASFVEKGVDSAWGVQLLEEDVITERAIACQIGRRLDEFAEPTLAQVHQVLKETVGSDDQAAGQVLNWYRQRET